MEKYIIWLIAVAIILSEIILKLSSSAGFVYYAALVTAVLILFHKIDLSEDVRKLAIIIVIFPTVRISSLFLKLPDFWRTAAGYYIFLFLVIFYLFKFKENVGFVKPKFLDVLLAIFIGLFFGFMGNSFLTINKNIPLLMILPLAALTEEIFFRGLIQNLAEKSLGKIHSIVLTSVVYGTAAIIFGIMPAIFFFFLSLVSCFLYSLTKNIFLTVIINFIVSLFIFIIPKFSFT